MSAASTRERILHAASNLFLEGGLASLSVRAIAKRAGLSTIGIYSQFDGKQGILDALYIEGFERVAEAMHVPQEIENKQERVIAACNAYLDVADNFAGHYQLIFGAADDMYTPSAEAKQVARDAFQGLLRLTQEFLPEQSSAKEVRNKAIQTWAILHGHVGLQQHAVAEELVSTNYRELALATVVKTFD